MKKYFAYAVALLALAWAASKLRDPRDGAVVQATIDAPTGTVKVAVQPLGNATPFHAEEFGRLPVLVNGRIKPLDTVARTTLLFLQNKQAFTIKPGERGTLEPTQWLLDVLFRPQVADTYRHFRIDNPETLALFGLSTADAEIEYESGRDRTMAALGLKPSTVHRFSFNQLRPGLDALQKQAEAAQQLDASQRTPVQREIATLFERVLLYQKLQYSFQLRESTDFAAEVEHYESILAPGVAATRARMRGETHDESAVQALAGSFNRFEVMAQMGHLLAVPPAGDGQEVTAWIKVGDSLLRSLADGAIAPQVKAYAKLGRAYRAQDAAAFNAELETLRASFDARFREKLDKAAVEYRFNHVQPFYLATVLFVAAFVAVLVSWLAWPVAARETAWGLGLAAVILTAGGIATRMYLEGRPPVTNLYSSALFVGFTGAALGLIVDRIYRNGVGTAGAGLVGFACLIIAHNLSFGGDTMEMMRAVLDDNFWLATHVVVITLGYGAMFIGGVMAVIYVIMGVFTRWLRKPFDESAVGTGRRVETNAQALYRMVYGIVCFSTLFSLVGTILGGIWADQSWGRFWGWDPKENGALIIVLWCAIVLHARWGGWAKERGVMLLAIFGNVVTGWSWFGVNLLGVGLHSYGFTTGAFTWLSAFWLANLAVIVLGLLPTRYWVSHRAGPADQTAGDSDTPPTLPRPVGTR